MRINTNISAMNTYSRLTAANNSKSGSLAKLSSGLRINKAGDDAAGLAISEKMRGQIGGLKQATRNAQDAISLIQTAEGGLNETHSILNRMRDLAVQSSSDTNTDTDRNEIQKEMNQLAEEISRISKNTEFNTKGLLDGGLNATFHIGANKGQNLKLEIADMSSKALNVSGSGEGKANYEIKVADGGTTTAGATTLDKLGLKVGENKLNVVELENISTNGDHAVNANYGLANSEGKIVAISNDGKNYRMLTEATSVKDLKTATPDKAASEIKFVDEVKSGEVTINSAQAGNAGAEIITTTDVKATAAMDVKGLQTGEFEVAKFDSSTHLKDKTFHATDESNISKAITGGIANVLLDNEKNVVAVSFADAKTKFYAVDDIVFNADGKSGSSAAINGAEALMTKGAEIAVGDKFSIKADGGIDVSSQLAADAAIKTISDAIDTVSAERSKLGATQNRLDHTINNLTATAENLSEAESRIRDVDMAEEMMAFTKSNILSQAATSMLAQANQMPQGVLQLLQ